MYDHKLKQIRLSRIKLLNFILFYIFTFSAFVDNYSGYMLLVAGKEPLLSTLSKGVGIIFIILFLINNGKNNTVMNYLIIMVGLFVFSLIYWEINNYIMDFNMEITVMIKRIYPYLILVLLMCNIRYIENEVLINYVIMYGFIVVLSTFLSIFLGVAHRGYYGYGGLRGLFYRANDLGITMILINCLTCYMFLYTAQIKYMMLNILISAVTINLSTVAGIFGTLAIIVSLAFSRLIIKNYKKIIKSWQKIYLRILLLLLIPIFGYIVTFFISKNEYMRNKFSLERLLSGGAREGLRIKSLSYLKEYTICDFLLGKGASNISYTIEAAELDHYDLLTEYGLILGSFFLIIPLLFGLRYLMLYLKHRNIFYFWGLLAITLFVFHGFTAGHAFKSIMAMPVIAVFCFIYSNYEQKN